MPRRTYTGPVDAIATRLPSGREVTVERGQTVEVTADEAALLDAQTGNWTDPDDSGTRRAAKTAEKGNA